MNETENLASFVIDFTATSRIKEDDMHLTFFNPGNTLIPLNRNYLTELNTKLKNIERGQIISAIEKINTVSTTFKDVKTSYVILCRSIASESENKKRAGYLLGIDGDGKSFLIAVWPYKLFLKKKDTFNEIEKDIQYLVNHLNEFDDLLLLKQK